MNYGEFLDHLSTGRGLILAPLVMFLCGLLLYTHVVPPKFLIPSRGGKQNNTESPLALIPPFFLDCVVAIGRVSREGRMRWGASGFLYGDFVAQITPTQQRYRVFLGTNRHVLEPKSSPSPAWYLLDLLTCAEPAHETPAPDAAPVRACMEARGYQVPW
jgi:hypothetical protein